MDLKTKYSLQFGVSLAEALMAVIISTLVMSTAYHIYNSFQKTFVRQINHNIIKQEVRFAIHTLQRDTKMAGYRHVDNTTNIQRAVYLEDSDGNEVSDTNEADTVYICLDTIDSSNNIQRKIIRYELRKAQSTDVNKTVLMKQIYNTTNCVDNSDSGTPTWLPVAKYFKKFKIIKYNTNILNFEIQMEDPAGQIIEKYNAAAFMRNISYVRTADVNSADVSGLTLTAGAVERTYSQYVLDDSSPYDDQSDYDAYFGASQSPTIATVTSISRNANVATTTSYTMTGYFRAPSTGIFTFYINSDDGSYLFLGDSANNPPVSINLSNAVVNNGGKHSALERSGRFYLEKDQYYKLFAVFGNDTGPGTAIFSYDGPNITKTTNFTGRLFYNSATNGH